MFNLLNKMACQSFKTYCTQSFTKIQRKFKRIRDGTYQQYQKTAHQVQV